MEAKLADKPEAKSQETARQRFIRVANKRVVKAIKAIQLVGNLSNPAYQYDEKDVAKIFDAIQSEVDQARSKFATREKSGTIFSLE